MRLAKSVSPILLLVLLIFVLVPAGSASGLSFKDEVMTQDERHHALLGTTRDEPRISKINSIVTSYREAV